MKNSTYPRLTMRLLSPLFDFFMGKNVEVALQYQKNWVLGPYLIINTSRESQIYTKITGDGEIIYG